MSEPPATPPESGPDDVAANVQPQIVGDVVFGSMDSPVAVCTLGSRSLLAELAGRSEIAVAGRVFTENVGIERMVQNLVGISSIRYLIVCGRETQHHVGQTILALHRAGLDEQGRVIGSEAPEPQMPNLTPEQLRHFQEQVTLVDMVGEQDAAAILARAAALAALPIEPTTAAAGQVPAALPVEHVMATRDPASAWVYDPIGYFLVFVDLAHGQLRVEHYDQQHRLLRVIWGRGADEISHTIVRLGLVTVLPHAAYLGRELGRAESAMRLGVHYEQDRPVEQANTAEGESSS